MIDQSSCGMSVFGLIVWLDMIHFLIWLFMLVLQLVQKKLYTRFFEEAETEEEHEGRDMANRIVNLDKELGVSWSKSGK